METRNITIVSTKLQVKKVIKTSAETLRDLKNDLDKARIDYSGMVFYEGLTKTELKDNSSILPHDVPFKGKITNELVIMLTNTNKRIKSGANMSRADIYAEIKENGLQAECVKRFGKNFTMCKTADLIALVNEEAILKPDPSEEKPECENPSKKEEVIKTEKVEPKEQDNSVEHTDIRVRAAFLKLVGILQYDGTIEDYEREEIEHILNDDVVKDFKSESTLPYSNGEIDDMFDFIRD